MSKNEKQAPDVTFATNRRARHEYEVISTVEAGLVLTGGEVKSIRLGNANLQESYVRFRNDELYLVGCHITPYKFERLEVSTPDRDRKLLLHRRELEKLFIQVSQKGLTLIPLKLYSSSGRVKLEISLARGKKLHDKRSAEKEKEGARRVARAIKHHR